MERGSQFSNATGYSLVELLLVVCVLAICLMVGSLALATGVHQREARGAAQTWQAGAAWTQIAAVWTGVDSALDYDQGTLKVADAFGPRESVLNQAAADVDYRANVARWTENGALSVAFGGSWGSPNGGGSVYFAAPSGEYRVAVRPVSGLTSRTRVDTAIP